MELGSGDRGVLLSHEQGYYMCSWLGEELAAAGYHVVLFEYRNHGASEMSEDYSGNMIKETRSVRGGGTSSTPPSEAERRSTGSVQAVEPVALPLGRPREERADAARNRAHLIAVAREMVAELGVDKVTMDGLAERAGLGKGTVFRRFRTRAGIFHTLLDEEETLFQQRVMAGPPPLGPGAPAAERLTAFGRARLEFLVEHIALARASLDPGQPVPAGDSPSLFHVHMLLTEACPDEAASGTLALQLVAALEGPILLYLQTQDGDAPDPGAVVHNLITSWQVLVERVCR